MVRHFSTVAFLLLGSCVCPGASTLPPADGGVTDGGSGPQDAGDSTDAGLIDGGTGNDGGIELAFIALGDTGMANAAQNKVAGAMVSWCASHRCDFVLLLGDNFYPSGVASTSDSQWATAFESVYAGLNIPFYAALGNHDYGGGGSGMDTARAQAEIDYTLVSTKWKMPANHYRFTQGPVEIFVADTNLALFGTDQTMRSNFQAWTAASTARWKFAAAHHPYLSNGPHGNAGTYDGTSTGGTAVKRFVEDELCGKVDVYLSGHDHSRQWLTPTCNGTELIVSGGGATPTTVTPRYAAYFSKATSGFVYFAVEQDKLTGIFVDADGQAEFTRTLTQ